MKRLYLDDKRIPLKELEFIVVRNYNEFVDYIQTEGVPDLISFDHDLADEHVEDYLQDPVDGKLNYDTYQEKTGYDAAKWIIDFCEETGASLPISYVHSQNTVGALNIKSYINNYLKHKKLPQNCNYFWWPQEGSKQ